MEKVYTDTQQRYKQLIQIAQELSNLEESEILSSRKQPNIIWRYAICMTLRNEGHTFSNIGKVLGKDHSSVVHACASMRDIIKYNPTSLYTKIWKIFTSSITEPVVEKKYITTVSLVEDWLDSNSVPQQIKINLLNTISSIGV